MLQRRSLLQPGSRRPRDRTRAVRTSARRCRWSARTATSIRACSRSTSRSPIPPRSSSSPITTSSGCSTRRACRWSRWASHASTAPRSRQTRAGSGSCSATTSTCFAGTPSGAWLAHEFEGVFGDRPSRSTAASAMRDLRPDSRRACGRPEFRPRALFDRFNIEVLCTTDAATDTLGAPRSHPRIGLDGRRAADVPARPRDQHPASELATRRSIGWRAQTGAKRSRRYASYIRALEHRRAFFKSMGATATDHAAETPFTAELSAAEAAALFDRALAGQATGRGRARFSPGTC